MNTNENAQREARLGVIYAIAAYTMWGFAPLYFKQLAAIPSTEVLMHRIVWSVVILCMLVIGLRQGRAVITAMKSARVMQILLVASILLAGNWLLFIWAIVNDRLLEASLGYYINPLINVFLGRLFLGERLRRPQQVAVVLAVLGVSYLVVAQGELPWIALVLALSFSVYGLLRKQVAVSAMPGLFIETLFLLPVALFYWWYYASSASNLVTNTWADNLWLIAAGVVTTAPLLCFTAAARRIMYSTLGFFQYIGPSLMFVAAIFLYHEPLASARLVTFGFVWTALALFSWDSWRYFRQQRRQARDAKAL